MKQVKLTQRRAVAGAVALAAVLGVILLVGLSEANAPSRNVALTAGSSTIPPNVPTTMTPAIGPNSGVSPGAVETTIPSTPVTAPTASEEAQAIQSEAPTTGETAPTTVPVASIPSTTCVAADLTASLQTGDSFPSMNYVQDVITLSSSVPCSIEGYPTMAFSNGTSAVTVSVTDGGTSSSVPTSPAPVAVGPATSASFLVQFQPGPIPPCTSASTLDIGLPGVSPTVGVSIPDLTSGPAWDICNARASITPFEQGSSLSQYIS